jgi:hypothetical protein
MLPTVHAVSTYHPHILCRSTTSSLYSNTLYLYASISPHYDDTTLLLYYNEYINVYNDDVHNQITTNVVI